MWDIEMGKTLEEFHFGLKGLPVADVAFCYKVTEYTQLKVVMVLCFSCVR